MPGRFTQGRAVRRATAVFTTVTDVADHGRLIW
ncbi:insertion sequence B9 [Mycobacterium tuberculosis]|nr:insertion sequence B9 [Mycobacterium tuberculosis]